MGAVSHSDILSPVSWMQKTRGLAKMWQLCVDCLIQPTTLRDKRHANATKQSDGTIVYKLVTINDGPEKPVGRKKVDYLPDYLPWCPLSSYDLPLIHILLSRLICLG